MTAFFQIILVLVIILWASSSNKRVADVLQKLWDKRPEGTGYILISIPFFAVFYVLAGSFHIQGLQIVVAGIAFCTVLGWLLSALFKDNSGYIVAGVLFAILILLLPIALGVI